MSFVRSLFPSSKRRKTEEFARPEPPVTAKAGSKNEICCTSSAPLVSDAMRLVLVAETEQRVLFDSAAVVAVADRVVPGSQRSPCGRFQFLKRRRDVRTLAQLLFGAMPTSHGSDSVKIHTLADDERVLISRVFGVARSAAREVRLAGCERGESGSSDGESQPGTVRSLDGLRLARTLSAAASASTAPPERFVRVRVRNASLQLDEESDELRTFSPPHRLSKNRRIAMSRETNMCDDGTTTRRWKSRSRLSSCGSATGDDDGTKQVGLAVMLEKEERQFVFQHMSMLEHEMCRLEARLATATTHPATFIENTHNAWSDFCRALCELHNAPRLRRPVWLSMMEHAADEAAVAEQFCARLALLLRHIDTKHTKFFVSNVVSAVLMHHMSWVASVAPTFHPSTTKDDPLTPYNMHLAQYLEINGSMGAGRAAKTVIVGGDEDTLASLISVLSYFVRCSAIHQKGSSEQCGVDDLPASHSFSPDAGTAASSAASSATSASPPLERAMRGGEKKDTLVSPHKNRRDHKVCEDSDAASTCSLESLPSVSARGGTKVGSRQPEGLGRSLLAGPSTHFSPHFVLSGLVRNKNEHMSDAFVRMLEEVGCGSDDPLSSLSSSQSGESAGAAGGATETASDNVIILADCNDWTVKVLCGSGVGELHSPADAVVSMLEQFGELASAGCPPPLLVAFLEDSLSDVLSRSVSLAQLVQAGGEPLSPDKVRAVVGCDHSDLRLLLNVAAVYWPPVLSSVH